MKRVLIITYYWPPSGGSGVQRWLKFVKYLRDFGWEPVIYTPSNGEMPAIDNSLEKDIPAGITILKQPIWEPYSLYKLFIGQKKDSRINAGFLTENKKPKLTEKLAVWLRGNFFIPDARKFWIGPSVNYLKNYLKQHPVKVVISTGPPHSMHLIAMKLKQELQIPWVADFRDPWTNIDFYKELMLTALADKKHKDLELKVLRNADIILSIGETLNNEFKDILANAGVKQWSPHKFKVITNGYDETDLYKGVVTYDTNFSIAHIGTMVRSRNPEVLWKVLARLVANHAEFRDDLKIKLVGKVDIHVMQSIEKYGLSKFVMKIDYLPHDEIIKVQQQSQLLLLVLNNTNNAKGILTGKFFEYLSANRPILGIGPVDGDAAKIIAETRCGKIVGYDDELRLFNIVTDYYTHYKNNTLFGEAVGIEKYSRYLLTKDLAETLTHLI